MQNIPRPLLLVISILLALLPLSILTVFASSRAYPQSFAAILTVTTTADELNTDGDCSLREAIQAANTDSPADLCGTGSGADTIILPAGIFTLTLVGAGDDANLTGDLDILDHVTLSGAGAGTTIISGNLSDRVLHIANPATNVHVHALTISDGTVSSDFGGGIYNAGILTITNVTIENNSITGTGNRHGTALYNNGQAILDQALITGNVGFQGTVYNEAGQTLTVSNSTIALNNANIDPGRGGAIYATGGIVTLLNSLLDGNISSDGAAIMQLGGVLNIDQTSIQNHHSTTGAATGGAITLGSGVVVTIQNSLLYNNLADNGGGGIYLSSGSLTITNTTIASNTTSTNGGGLLLTGGTVNMFYSTVAYNTSLTGGGGGLFQNAGTLNIANTLVGNNIAGTGPDCFGTIGTGDFNLVENITGCGFTPGAFDITGVDPLIAPLDDYGGGTWTHGLLPGSPALDQIPGGVNGCGTLVVTDQRGSPRPLNAACDIGSFEGMVVNNPPIANDDAYSLAENTTLQIPGASGLVGYWRLDEGSGTLAADSSGLSNDGVLIGPPAWDGGITAPLNFSNPFALDFDGTGTEYVSVPDHPSLTPGNELTLSAWVNLRNVTADSKIVGKAEVTANFGYVLGVANGNIYPEVWDNTNTYFALQAGSVLTNTWTHLAMTWQTNGDLIGYVNGVEAGRIAASSNPVATNTNALSIGTSPWNPTDQPANGLIDDVRVYTRVLSPDEITAMAYAGVLENDTDPDGDLLTVSLLTPPTHGTLVSFALDGGFGYAPSLNFTGVDTFTYVTSDGTLTDTATVHLTVFPAGNNPPIAASDVYTLPEDAGIYLTPAGGLLNGDSDPDGDPISVTQVTPPANGTLLYFNPDGSFGYQPNPDFHGADTFDYVISDGFLTDTASVTMTVYPVNDFPIAVSDAFTGSQDIPLSVSAPGILSNDSDVELDPLTAFLATPPTGTLLLNSNGSFDFTPPPGYTGTLTFTYTASDGNGYALEFDGLDDHVDLGDTFEAFPAATFEAWIYHTPITGTFHEINSKEGINSFSINHAGGDVLHFNLGDGISWGVPIESLTPIPANQWTHVAATWDGTTGEVRLYINGQLDNTGIINIVIGDNAMPRALGYKPGTQPEFAMFPGRIDEVRAWNIVRSQEDIQASLYTHLNGNEPGLAHYFKMHEETGQAYVYDAAGITVYPLMNMDAATDWVNSPLSFSAPTPVTIHLLPAGAGPDLTVPTLIASPNNVCQGEFFALIFAVSNQGTQPAGSFDVLIYDDDTPTGFTNQTFDAPIPGATAGQTAYYGLTINSFITGTRYIKAFADGYDIVPETNELNNSAVIPLTVQADPAPTGTILINGGAITATLPNLTLTLSAVDEGNCATAPAEMRFNYDGRFTQWEPYTPTKSIIVLSTGEVRVAVQFRDEHNNVSVWFETTITLGNIQKIYLPVILR